MPSTRSPTQENCFFYSAGLPKGCQALPANMLPQRNHSLEAKKHGVPVYPHESGVLWKKVQVGEIHARDLQHESSGLDSSYSTLRGPKYSHQTLYPKFTIIHDKKLAGPVYPHESRIRLRKVQVVEDHACDSLPDSSVMDSSFFNR